MERKREYFYKNKRVTKIDDIDVNKILGSKEKPYSTKNSFKCFIGYNDNNVIRPLCVKLPQKTGYVGNVDGNATMSFKINDKQFLKKYIQIWKRAEKLLKIEFNSKPVYGDIDKYIKTKIKIYAGSVITNFQDKKIAQRKSTMFIDNNTRFCYWIKEKILSSNTFGRMKIWTRKDKNGEPYRWWFRKKWSDESDSDSNDETESTE